MSQRNKPRVFRANDPALAAAPPPQAIEAASLLPDAETLRTPPPGKLSFWTLFWGAVLGLIGLALGAAAYEFIAGLVVSYQWVGWIALGLMTIILAGLVIFTVREIAGLSRLSRIDNIRDEADFAWETHDHARAEIIRDRLNALYRNRPELDRARVLIGERAGDSPDADALLTLLERETLRDLDAEALEAVKTGARSVAAATAILPVGLLDAAAVLFLNIRMTRQVAAVYGGRAGWFGSWRLLKQVAFHLAATGAIALGDDLFGAILGGGALAKLSRRAGEGLLNGALTARIGIAAIEVSRPMPYRALPQPSVKNVAAAALKRGG